jgi:hypothetical protein
MATVRAMTSITMTTTGMTATHTATITTSKPSAAGILQAKRLPPGLAKKDRLPRDLEKQLVRNGTLPPGLQKRLYPAPVELERCLPPPPPDCAHVLVSGHIVLLNRKTNLIVDVFAF